MEICQNCEMYMKPFVDEKEASCEFCGEVIARKTNNGWVKSPKLVPVNQPTV